MLSLLIAAILSSVLSLQLIDPSIVANEYLNFGRLVPLHLDWTLYGWLSFPLIGFLFDLKGKCRPQSSAIKIGLWFWFSTLILSSLYILLGHSSGKLFLEFTDLSRYLFTLNLATLSMAYIIESFFIAKQSFVQKYILNTCAVLVPIVWFFASSAKVYPPINPNSGGPTGASLMASTLVILPVFILLAEKLDNKITFTDTKNYWILLLVHFLIFVFISDHGSISNDNLGQIVAIASLIIWPFLLIKLFFKNPSSAYLRSWKLSMFVWFGILSISALIMFLPSVLSYAKFTSIIVAHTHLAMAGFLSSFSFLVLGSIIDDDLITRCFPKTFFKKWHGIQIAHITILLLLGLTELGSVYYHQYSIIHVLKYSRFFLSVFFVIMMFQSLKETLCYLQKRF